MRVVGRVLAISYVGAFNEEGYMAFVKNAREHAAGLQAQPWGTIDNISNWELSVHATAGLIRQAVQASVKLNRRFIAIVDSKQGFAQSVFLNYVRDIEGLECRLFSSEDAAWQWYRELGLLNELSYGEGIAARGGDA